MSISQKAGFTLFALPLVLAMAPLVAGGASAQQPADSVALSGWVVDAGSMLPLSSAYVVHEESGLSMVTGEGGAFRLVVPRAEGYELRVGRFGYREMFFDIGPERLGGPVILPLEVAPIPLEGLEVTVDRLEEVERRLDTRARAYGKGAVRTIDGERLRATGAGSALDLVLRQGRGILFECRSSPGEMCAPPRAAPVSFRFRPPSEVGVTICLDERTVWGGTDELQAIPGEEIYRIELYGFGGRDQIRLYTRAFMARSAVEGRRALLALAFGC